MSFFKYYNRRPKMTRSPKQIMEQDFGLFRKDMPDVENRLSGISTRDAVQTKFRKLFTQLNGNDEE